MMEELDTPSSDALRIPAAITDAGCERELNEDRYAVIECASGTAWLVCDGMGGVAGGELAAQLAIDSIRRDLENLPARSAEEALKGAILEANRIIVLRRQNPAFAQMGTTVVSVLFSEPEVVIAHAGDSRAYLVRNGAIEQLTTDHTFVQELVEKGVIKAEDSLTHPDAHVLTRCIGSEPGLNVSVHKFWIWQMPKEEPQDLLLLCTDGLYSMISDQEMAGLVSSNTPQRACVRMVELAKSRGGYDNITVAIIPLSGQLREDPPIGYRPTKLPRQGGARSTAVKVSGKGVLRYFLIVAALSFLCVLVMVLVLAFMVKS
jgi:PPM family protein phosphatase